MKRDLKNIYNSIQAITPEMVKEFDDKEREAYKRSKENYIKNSKGLKKYLDLYKKLQKEDPRLRTKKSENKPRRSIIKEQNNIASVIKVSDAKNYDSTNNLIFRNSKDSTEDVVSNINFGESFNSNFENLDRVSEQEDNSNFEEYVDFDDFEQEDDEL